jgi:hypothetical protein
MTCGDKIRKMSNEELFMLFMSNSCSSKALWQAATGKKVPHTGCNIDLPCEKCLEATLNMEIE